MNDTIVKGNNANKKKSGILKIALYQQAHVNQKDFFFYLLFQYWHLSPILQSVQTHLYPDPSMQESSQVPSFVQGDEAQALGIYKWWWNFQMIVEV